MSTDINAWLEKYKFGWVTNNAYPGTYWIDYVKLKYGIDNKSPTGTFKDKDTLIKYVKKEKFAFLSIEPIIINNFPESELTVNLKQKLYKQAAIIRALIYIFSITDD